MNRQAESDDDPAAAPPKGTPEVDAVLDTCVLLVDCMPEKELPQEVARLVQRREEDHKVVA